MKQIGSCVEEIPLLEEGAAPEEFQIYCDGKWKAIRAHRRATRKSVTGICSGFSA